MTRVEAEIAQGRATIGHRSTRALSGLPLYRRLGYRSLEPIVLAMPGDLNFIGVRMEKRLIPGLAISRRPRSASAAQSLPGTCSGATRLPEKMRKQKVSAG